MPRLLHLYTSNSGRITSEAFPGVLQAGLAHPGVTVHMDSTVRWRLQNFPLKMSQFPFGNKGKYFPLQLEWHIVLKDQKENHWDIGLGCRDRWYWKSWNGLLYNSLEIWKASWVWRQWCHCLLPGTDSGVAVCLTLRTWEKELQRFSLLNSWRRCPYPPGSGESDCDVCNSCSCRVTERSEGHNFYKIEIPNQMVLSITLTLSHICMTLLD